MSPRLGLKLHLYLVNSGPATLTFTYLEFRQRMFLRSSVLWETRSKSCTPILSKRCAGLFRHIILPNRKRCFFFFSSVELINLFSSFLPLYLIPAYPFLFICPDGCLQLLPVEHHPQLSLERYFFRLINEDVKWKQTSHRFLQHLTYNYLQLCSYMPLVVIPCLWFFRQFLIRDSAPNPKQIELNLLAGVHEAQY